MPSDPKSEASDHPSHFQLIREGFSWSGHEKNKLFLNTGERFHDVSSVSGFDFPDDGRAMGFTDWDHDGDLDVWINNRNAPQLRFLRNNTDTKADHWITLNLHGTTCNRDAIGARVTLSVETGGVRKSLVRTARAGDGYLAQSSKRLHFGLGLEARIKGLTVRWPGGDTEDFSAPEADQHYQITQGEGKPVAWQRPSPASAISKSGAIALADSSISETILAYQLPSPVIPYQTIEQKDTLAQADGRYQLINLWATWCLPCLAEFKEFTNADKDLSDANISVLALSVEALDDPDGLGKVRAFLSKKAYPFTIGLATDRTLLTLRTVHNELFESRRQFPVPFSLLLSPENKVVAVFKGPVSPKRLIEIVRAEPGDQTKRLPLATPYPGTWAAIPYHYQLAAYLRSCLRAGFGGDVERILDGSEPHEDDELPLLYAELAQDAEKSGQIEKALAYYSRAVDLKPDNVAARLNLGLKLAANQRLPEAEAAFRKAASLDESLTQAWVQLGSVQMKLRMKEDAIVSLEKALALEPGEPVAHAGLGAIRRSEGNLKSALSHFEAAVSSQPSVSMFRFHLALTQEMAGDHAAAVGQYRTILNQEPREAGVLNKLAWLQATSYDPKVINAGEALAHARTLVDIAGRTPQTLDTLAAAQAASGDFEAAVDTLTEAISSSPQADPRLEQRLQLYSRKQPYRSSPPP